MLQGKNIVIIGGTSGIGLSAARYFVQNGARLVVLGMNPEVADQAGAILGKEVIVVKADAREENSAGKAIEACVTHFGSLNGLYHVAGGSGRKMGDGALHELSLEGWNKTFELNLTSLMLSNRAAVQDRKSTRLNSSHT